MNFRSARVLPFPGLVLLILAILLCTPSRSPAPIIYRPGEGWSYEPYGSEGKWRMQNAKDQLEVAQSAFDKRAYNTALKSARRVVKVWPLSDYAPQAQYLVGRCLEAKGQEERAFKEYQKLLEKYPKIASYPDVLQREVAIADQFLAGKWFKLWGVIPFFRSMDKTADMYSKIVQNGPFSDVAPEAQLKLGTAREKQRQYALAAKAYETAADRYHDRPKVAAEALYRQGLAFHKQAQTAEYDQTAATQAISVFGDFMTLYPEDPRVPKADKLIGALKTEQARGNFVTAHFYEKRKKLEAAKLYYNEASNLDPNSTYGVQARERIDELNRRIAATSQPAPQATPAAK